MRARRGRGLGRGRPARGRAQTAPEEEPGPDAPPAPLPELTPAPDKKAGWAGGDYLQPAATPNRLYELGNPEGQIIEAIVRDHEGVLRGSVFFTLVRTFEATNLGMTVEGLPFAAEDASIRDWLSTQTSVMLIHLCTSRHGRCKHSPPGASPMHCSSWRLRDRSQVDESWVVQEGIVESKFEDPEETWGDGSRVPGPHLMPGIGARPRGVGPAAGGSQGPGHREAAMQQVAALQAQLTATGQSLPIRGFLEAT